MIQDEMNVPMFRVGFTKGEEFIEFSMKACSLEKFSELVNIELATRVVSPNEWALGKVQRYMYVPRQQPPEISERFFESAEE